MSCGSCHWTLGGSRHPRADATAWYVGDIQGCRLWAVQLAQARAGVRQPDALARRSAIDRTEPVAAIPHREFDVQPRSTRGYAKQRGSGTSRDAVAKRVLDQRLQDERRHERGADVGIDVPRHVQPIAKAYELDVDEASEVAQLVGERNLGRHLAVERRAKQIAESREHVDGGVVLSFPDETGDRIQRIEQEVRIELHAKRMDARLREIQLQSCGS